MSGIFLGGDAIKAIKVGDQDAKAVYVGSEQVWPSSPSNIINFTFTSEGAADDLFDYLGRKYGTISYANPSTNGWLAGYQSAASHASYPSGIRALTDRSDSSMIVQQVADNYAGWDLSSRRSMRVTRFALKNRHDHPDSLVSWKFQASNDLNNWTDLLVFTTAQWSAQNTWESWPVSDTGFYRFFRILRTGNTSSNTQYLPAGEAQMWGSLRLEDLTGIAYPPPDELLSVDGLIHGLGASVLASDVFSGSYVAANAIDKNFSTTFHSSTNASPWLRFDFGSGAAVIPYEIHMASRHDGPHSPFYNSTLQGSNDASSWDTIHTWPGVYYWTGLSNGATTYLSVVPPSTGYRYLRFQNTGLHLSMSEVEIYGDA